MRGSRASIGRPRLADLTVVAELRLEAVNSGGYQSQGSGNGIICQVQCLIMLARGIGVQVSPPSREATWPRRGLGNRFRVRRILTALSVLRSGLIDVANGG